MMTRFVIVVCLLLPFFAQAQSDTASIFMLFRDTTGGKGTVNIHQDPLVRFLVDRDIEIHQRQRGIKDGYRIQIFSSFGNDSRDRSRNTRVHFLTKFPDFDPVRVYSTYEPPFIKVRVGDYRNRQEALEDYREISKSFPDSYIVKSRINYPSLYPYKE
jgi:hypothetical protein